MIAPPHPVPRRGFLGRAAAAALAVAAGPRLFGSTPSLAAQGQARNPDAWLDRLNAPHRAIYDMPNFEGGLPLVHMLNHMNTYNTAYGVQDSGINLVGTFYGNTTLVAANDAMWAKYRIGELLDQKDPAGAHWTRNPWRSSVHALGMEIAPAGIEAMQRRGVTFIVCNNALGFFFGVVAQARSADRAAVEADIRANLLPGVTVVPAMVIALEKAQAKGLSYKRE